MQKDCLPSSDQYIFILNVHLIVCVTSNLLGRIGPSSRVAWLVDCASIATVFTAALIVEGVRLGVLAALCGVTDAILLWR